jgi:hypothetical protein
LTEKLPYKSANFRFLAADGGRLGTIVNLERATVGIALYITLPWSGLWVLGRVRFTPVTTCFAPDHKPEVSRCGAFDLSA